MAARSLTNVDASTTSSNGKIFSYPAFGVANLAHGTHTIKVTVAGRTTRKRTGPTSSSTSSSSPTHNPRRRDIGDELAKQLDGQDLRLLLDRGRTHAAEQPGRDHRQRADGVPGAGALRQLTPSLHREQRHEHEHRRLPSGSTQLTNTDFTGRTIQSLTLPTSSTATGNSAVFANSGGCP